MFAPILIDHSKNRDSASTRVPFRDTFQTVSKLFIKANQIAYEELQKLRAA